MKEWRLLDLEYKDPYRNMALEETLLTAVERNIEPNTIRFWRNMNTVVIGCSQDIELEVNLEACRRYGASIVRRFTGGGAVYHDPGNLNWTIVARRGFPPVRKINGVPEIFEVFSKPLIEGLKTLGISAEFRRPNSIYLGGRKISGMAAYFKRKSILCHGTLLVNTNLHILSRVLNLLKAEATTLQRELGRRVSMIRVKGAVIRGYDMMYNVRVKPRRLSRTERLIMEKLYREKYVREEWNFMRNARAFWPHSNS